MTQGPELDAEFIDLGAATTETRGNGSGIVPDAPQPRLGTGILAD
jgi:hypothetical protein